MDEIPKYRKKAKKKTPPKAKHKHVYEDCVIEYPLEIPWKPGETRRKIESYCPICGKRGYMMNTEKWTANGKGKYGYFVELSDAAIAELNDETRTLPLFYVPDYVYTKYFDLEQKQC